MSAEVQATPVVQTSVGTVEGTVRDGVAQFLGIPYGSPPVGELRFRPPEPAPPWGGIRSATTYGPSSYPTLTDADREYFPNSRLWSVYAGYDASIPFHEDCLRLNVWTSAGGTSNRPVLVWLHGGGFSWGSGSSPLTTGDRLARDHGLVVVTVNHRLGVLGYLHVDGEDDSAIAGLLDLRLALEWVRDNIAAFGGDPHNVTIAGHSGGASKVACLLALPAARGLFQRAIIMSGVVTLRSMTLEEAQIQADALWGKAGLPTGDIGALRRMPAAELCRVAGGLRFRPAVGEPGMPVHPFDDAAAPSASGIPLLTGVAKDDAATFKWDSDPSFAGIGEAELHRRVLGLPGVTGAVHARTLIDHARAQRPGATSARLLVDISTRGLRERTERMLELKDAQSPAAIWDYEFAHDIVMPAETAFAGEPMAPHGAELPFMFDLPGHEWLVGAGPAREVLSRVMSGYWSNFVRTGDPNGAGLPPWDQWTAEIPRIQLLT
ncbi:carboxylesterase/lipase family protein [Gryllotalpicola protaetiae]|uniref:carboxylesterase/lipase family protein n=1 Tax=Gryllotalpicola protaetiae TaxID=2419771 RepID=UPI0013C41077|nr:carboxylesterase family protein [Gryllotalpicola protaetiae]